MEPFAGGGELLLRPADPWSGPQLEEDLEGGSKMLSRIATATHPPQSLAKAQLGSGQLEWIAGLARQGNGFLEVRLGAAAFCQHSAGTKSGDARPAPAGERRLLLELSQHLLGLRP